MTHPFLKLLGPGDLADSGIPGKWRAGMADRVRFSELDALNHVNHTAYLRWFESFRLHYCRDYGVSDYTEASPELVLKSVTVGYHAPMLLNETYIVTGRTASFRNSSFVMEYAVFAPDLRVEGTALVVLLERDGGGKFPLTEQMRAAFRSRDDAIDAG